MDHLAPPVGADGAPPLAVPADGVGAVPAQREESMGAVPPQTPDTFNAVRAKHADASRSEAAPAPATAGAGTVSMQAADDFDGAWEAVTSAAVALAEAPVWRLGDEALVERVREFEGARARLEAHRLTLLRELDDRGWAARVGAASTASWLAQAVRCDPRAAAADVRAARHADREGGSGGGPDVARSARLSGSVRLRRDRS